MATWSGTRVERKEMTDERLYPGIEVYLAGEARRPDTFLWDEDGWHLALTRTGTGPLRTILADPAWPAAAERVIDEQPGIDDDDVLDLLAVVRALRETPAGYGFRIIAQPCSVVLVSRIFMEIARANGADKDSGEGLIEWFEELAGGDRMVFGAWAMFWNRLVSSARAAVEASVSDGHHTRIARAASTYRRPGNKICRNETCPCESGKKYKKCCGKRTR